jgi:hypothetical protein
MKLNYEQAQYCASKFEEYFGKFGRIDEYIRDLKLNAMAERPNVLPGMGPETDLFSDFTMSPQDMNFELVELPQSTWQIYLTMISSHNVMASVPGRNLRFAVRETNTNKWMGFIRLGSPVINSKPRNQMLGRVFTSVAGGAQRFNQCATMGFTIVPSQPFGYNYLGGKLLAAICCSHEVREMINKKYDMTTCLFETTSLYGTSKSVSQYDGMKPYLKYIGLTDSDFLPLLQGQTYIEVKEYVENILGGPIVPETASSKKLKICNAIIAMTKEGLKGTPDYGVFVKVLEAAKGLNEQKRFFVSNYGFANTVDFINGDADTLIRGENFDKFYMENIVEWWKKKATNRFENLKAEGRLRTEQEVWTGTKEIDIIR